MHAGVPSLAKPRSARLSFTVRLHMLRALVIALGVLPATPSFAKSCTPVDARASGAAVDQLRSWESVYAFYQRYRQCDDASIAEGVSDKIEQLWVKHWDSLPEMIALTSKHAGFKSFVWKRIDEEIFPQDWFALVADSARHQCPEEAATFCDAVIRADTDMQPNNRSRGQ
jgi:hypothetical protein